MSNYSFDEINVCLNERKDDKKSRSHYFLILAIQYYTSSKMLLETIVNNDNKSLGIGDNAEEADNDLERSIIKSDAYLSVPAFFLAFHSFELYLKGLILYNDIEINNIHDVSEWLEKIGIIYGKNSSIYKNFKNAYNTQNNLLKDFRETNDIKSSKELHIALRYPEVDNRIINYYPIRFSGRDVLKEFSNIVDILSNINSLITTIVK